MEVTNFNNYGIMNEVEAGATQINNYYGYQLPHQGKEDAKNRIKRAEGEALMGKLVDAGKLDADWQPVGMSGSERALVAKAVCDRLEIKEVWQVFGLLWNEKPETLRSYFNKAYDQKKTLEFLDKLKLNLD